jgi:hypothetical protein
MSGEFLWAISNTRSLQRIELCGFRLHLLCTLTGGFILRRDDKWPNAIKCSAIAILFIFFLVILAIDYLLALIISLGFLRAALIRILKLVAI